MDTVWFSFVQILGILGDVSVSKLLGFETFPFFRWFRIRYRNNLVSKKVSDSVSKIFGIGKSNGFGIGKIWYREKVSDSVPFRFWVSSPTPPPSLSLCPAYCRARPDVTVADGKFMKGDTARRAPCVFGILTRTQCSIVHTHTYVQLRAVV